MNLSTANPIRVNPRPSLLGMAVVLFLQIRTHPLSVTPDRRVTVRHDYHKWESLP